MIVDRAQARVVGYHALTASGPEHQAATPRTIKSMASHPIPVVLLARLAIDSTVAGREIGAWLLRDAMTRTLGAAGTIGVRALLVHAIDDTARPFYLHHGREQSPTDQLHLTILVKDVASALAAAAPNRAAEPDD